MRPAKPNEKVRETTESTQIRFEPDTLVARRPRNPDARFRCCKQDHMANHQSARLRDSRTAGSGTYDPSGGEQKQKRVEVYSYRATANINVSRAKAGALPILLATEPLVCCGPSLNNALESSPRTCRSFPAFHHCRRRCSHQTLLDMPFCFRFHSYHQQS